MAQSYKALKEDFVSNLSGGDIWEINYVTMVAPAAVLLWSALQSQQAFFLQYGIEAFTTDFLLNVVAILLATTLYSGTPVLLNVLLIGPALILLAFPQSTKLIWKPAVSSRTNSGIKGKSKQEEMDPLPVRPFVTSYRGTMMVVTCIAILAVDFKIFPRRFAKVENWGTSLMDMGVGSFVFSAGVVAARPILKDRLMGKSTSLGARLYASVRRSLPLLVLGLVRLYSVKGLDYAEHVTEYGVHWNFFFTLAFLPPFVVIFQSFFAILPSYAILALLLCSTYQGLLEFTSLKAYMLTASRTDLLSQNREGVFSFFGYLGIFLAGQATGLQILPREQSAKDSQRSPSIERKRLLLRLTTGTVVWSFLLWFTLSYKYGLALSVSRRLANLPYFLWVSALNCMQLTLFCLIETLVFPAVYKTTDRATERTESEKATSRVLKSYNRNGLAIFLLANLLTGLTNLTVKTLDANKTLAIAILLGYAAVVTIIALVLDAKNISIKV